MIAIASLLHRAIYRQLITSLIAFLSRTAVYSLRPG